MEPDTGDEVVGFKAASRYLGIQRNTLSSYSSKGTGPRIKEKRIQGQYVLPVFDREELDRWKAGRPGQGARTDLIQVAA